MTRPRLASAPDLPGPGAWIPAIAVRVTLVVVGGALSLVDVGAGPWLVAGIAIAVVAAVVPRSLLGWGLILFLAAGRLPHHAALGWRLPVLIAGVHLLHLLSAFALQLPTRAWVRPAVFAPALRRYVAIQIPCQVVAVLALLALAPGDHGHRPLTAAAVGIAGAVALIGLVLLLLVADPDR